MFLDEQKLDEQILSSLHMWAGEARLDRWKEMLRRWKDAKDTVRVAIVGKYVHLADTYLSLNHALKHGGVWNDVSVELVFVDSEQLNSANIKTHLSSCDGILVPGGFGERGIEGKILAIQYARESNIPFFGICLGMQLAVIEFARTVLKLKDAHSREFSSTSENMVVELMNEQREITNLGGTMRLGAYPCVLRKGSYVAEIYGEKEISERHRHRYELNPNYFNQLESAGLQITGRSPDGKLAEMVELKEHPYFVACQFHPEFLSRPLESHPLFYSFIEASKKHKFLHAGTKKSSKHDQLASVKKNKN